MPETDVSSASQSKSKRAELLLQVARCCIFQLLTITLQKFSVAREPSFPLLH